MTKTKLTSYSIKQTAIFKRIITLLSTDPKGALEVKGFGTFKLVNIPARKTYHNMSGKNIVIKGYKKLKFTQSPELKKQLTK